MTKMHENEQAIDLELVRFLLKKQCPQWAKLELLPIPSSGTDNALFRLGSQYVVRIPRIEWSPGSVTNGINKEWLWLPQLARHLKIPISEPIFKGEPDGNYPWPWSITKWNEGHNPAFEKENEYEKLAIDLANFLNDLQGIKLSKSGPLSRRGVPLEEMNEETQKALNALENDMDTKPLASLWEQLANTPKWDNPAVWLHGDLLPGNILINNNRLSAVIDFADVGLGDPACDLIVAWSLLNEHSRMVFRKHLMNVDEHTWKRGQGWALSIALVIIPYYKNTNPVLASVAKRMIEQLILSNK
ncbi:aminoglycoside phosphotransferase family protein [Legionella saoudiensis]|uniref:aminoglycoside phosphotransferase family protein n=1 Tax=Legionella saoudiensis TaxID=1750561 RepID=UPI000731BFF7|nr:aminoglycoside phosphotransferase family protein [Legionella saoudiensis]